MPRYCSSEFVLSPRRRVLLRNGREQPLIPRYFDGLATLRSARRTRGVMLTATACGLAALLVTSLGRPLVGGTIHRIASTSAGPQAALTPLGRLVGEPNFGPLSSAVLGTAEGLLFGLGIALGVSRRSFPE